MAIDGEYFIDIPLYYVLLEGFSVILRGNNSHVYKKLVFIVEFKFSDMKPCRMLK